VLALGLLAVVPLGIATAGCSGSVSGATDDDAAATPAQGGTYNYPLAVDPGSFDPAIMQTLDGWAVLHQLYEGLVRWEEQPDGTMKTVPCLAESWSGNDDATVWTFELRRGVRFQAPVSREFTAADVVADLRYLTDPAHESQMTYMYMPIKGTDENGVATAAPLGVEAVDRYTVRFTLQYPFSEFPVTLGNAAFWVWPVDHLGEVGRKEYGRHPVGTGPYRFQRQVTGTSIDLVRNPDWWDTSGGPYIDALHYEVFSSVTSMMLAFQKGSIDWTPVPAGQVAALPSLPLVKSGRWHAVTTPSLALRYLLIDWRDPMVGGTQGLALRQALTYACERQAVNNASSGMVLLPPTTGVVPPGVPGAQGVKEPYAYDPAKAKELVESRGPVTLTLDYPIGQEQAAAARILTESYAKIGITIKARGRNWDPFWEDVLAGKAQLYFTGWIADYPSMDNFLYPAFESGSSPDSLGTCYSNPEVDAILAKARATTDQRARIQRYAEAERLVLADAPAIPLSVFADARLFNSRVVDVRFNSMSWVDLWRAWVR
jgi:peptide/nickel transport system substrate-binding protein/oligopeptide transport system substrate-binding protein